MPEIDKPESENPVPQPSDPLVIATAEPVVTVPLDRVTDPSDTDTTVDDGRFHQVPQAEFKKLKEKAHEKGRKAALAEITSKVKTAGYDSLEEALAEIPQLSARIDELLSKPEPKDKDTEPMAQQKKPTKNGQRTNNRGKTDRMESKNSKEISRLGRERQKDREKWRREEKRRKVAERRVDAMEAEMAVREVAINAGVKDVDYAIRLMTRECAKLDRDKLGEFDESAFFTTLRDSKPYLFGETTIPANTGTGAGSDNTPLEPSPGEVLTINADDTQFDARTAKKEDVDKRMRELGLSTSGSMMAG